MQVIPLLIEWMCSVATDDPHLVATRYIRYLGGNMWIDYSVNIEDIWILLGSLGWGWGGK